MLLRRLLSARAWRASVGALALRSGPEAASQDPNATQLPRLACLALLGAAGLTTAAQSESQAPPDADKGWGLLSLEQRRRVFFRYEKRLREMSPQEKVFDYFASGRDPNGVVYMLPGDMMRSVVPVYPPEGSDYVRSGSLAGEPDAGAPEEESVFFRNFDLDGDGRISFNEYMLFTTLLSIPTEDIEVAFKILDTDNSGCVDAREFSKLLEALQWRTGRPTATMRHIASADGGGGDRPQYGLMKRFFGLDGKQALSLEAFQTFIAALRHELTRLEFNYYDYQGRGYITGRDFAHSLVGCASPKYIELYLNKVDEMPADLAASKVTLQDMLGFREVWRQLRLLSVALEFIQNTSGVVKPGDFEWVAEHILHTKLSKAQVAVIFYLFPGKDGGLNVHYMHKVMQRHHATGLNIVYDYEQRDSRKSILDCVRDCYTK